MKYWKSAKTRQLQTEEIFHPPLILKVTSALPHEITPMGKTVEWSFMKFPARVVSPEKWLKWL